MSIPFPQIVVGTGTLLWNVWNSLILSLSYQFLLHCCNKLHGHCAQDSNHRGREVFVIQPQCDKRTTTTKNLKWYEVGDGTTCVSWKILNFINNIVVTINVGKGAEIQSLATHIFTLVIVSTRSCAYWHTHIVTPIWFTLGAKNKPQELNIGWNHYSPLCILHDIICSLFCSPLITRVPTVITNIPSNQEE